MPKTDNVKVVEGDMLVGFTKRDPVAPGVDIKDLWVGRGVFRFTRSNAGSFRNFTSYSTLLSLKKGDKIYPTLFINSDVGIVTLEGVQQGTAGDGVLTNLNVTKY